MDSRPERGVRRLPTGESRQHLDTRKEAVGTNRSRGYRDEGEHAGEDLVDASEDLAEVRVNLGEKGGLGSSAATATQNPDKATYEFRVAEEVGGDTLDEAVGDLDDLGEDLGRLAGGVLAAEQHQL
jgi:hypothetical protein